MGKIKKILENELVGGTQTTDIYPVTSTKAVYDENNKRLDNILIELEQSAGIYDVSAHNNGVVFESLSALLSSSNLSTLIPISVRHGGMSIRFIRTSDNKYVQYRLMSDTFNIIVANWERYNDVTASNQSFSDLDISDEEGNVIARFSDGEFQTKNFDTTNTPSQAEDSSTAEFQISDSEGNVIAEFQGGHFRTKEFNSRNLSGAEVVKDAQGRNILLFK